MCWWAGAHGQDAMDTWQGTLQATKVDKIEVRWPSGHAESIAPPAAVDRFYVITEGKGIAPQK